MLSRLGYPHARAGNVADALRLLDELRELKGVEYVSASTLAVIHLGLGQVEETMDWLEKAFEERCPLLVILPHWYEWDPYRDHPRFQRIYTAMGFDQHAAPRRSAEGAGKPRFEAG